MTTKTTSELVPGDVVVVDGRLRRTIARVVDSGWLNHADETIWTVRYAEGDTPEWSAANTAITETQWTLWAPQTV